MFRKYLAMTLVITVLLSGVIAFVHTDVANAQGLYVNPFSSLDKVREEKLKSIIEDPGIRVPLYKSQSLDEGNFIEDSLSSGETQYIIKFKDDIPMNQIFESISPYKYSRTFILKLVDLQDFEQRIKGLIDFIEENGKKISQIIPSDPYYQY
ncbi:hypothetical protein AAC978_01370 [Desulfitobacterium sp. THU1]|uniref:hypothetical protein n=1 Tax=Desulfitobacterium sp. THU1 TaxID=3138072 RepID=UPI00311F360F